MDSVNLAIVEISSLCFSWRWEEKIIIYKAHLKYELTQWVCNNSSFLSPPFSSVRIWSPKMKWVFKTHIIASWSASQWHELFMILKNSLVLLEMILDIYNWWCMTNFQNLFDTGVLTSICQSFALYFLLWELFWYFWSWYFCSHLVSFFPKS